MGNYTDEAVRGLVAVAPGDRTERDARAVANLKAWGAEDLLDVLGLTEPAPRPAQRSNRGAALTVPCPTCQAPIGRPCTTPQIHRTRYRLAVRERNLTEGAP